MIDVLLYWLIVLAAAGVIALALVRGSRGPDIDVEDYWQRFKDWGAGHCSEGKGDEVTEAKSNDSPRRQHPMAPWQQDMIDRLLDADTSRPTYIWIPRKPVDRNLGHQ